MPPIQNMDSALGKAGLPELLLSAHRDLLLGLRSMPASGGFLPSQVTLGNGRSRLIADVPDRGRGRDSWAESRPTGVAQETAGIDRRPGIRRHAVSPHLR